MKQKLTPEQKAKIIAQTKKELEAVKAKQEKLDIQQKSLIKQQKEYEKKNKLLFFNDPDKGYLGKNGKWESNPIQKKYFQALRDPQYKIYGLVGANRISKTFSSTGVTVLTALRGCFPWEDPNEVGTWFWNSRNWEPPIKMRIVGQDWEKHVKTVIISTIKELWPHSWGFQSRKNGQGVEATWTHPSGSTIEILSNSSESELFEGWNGHIIIYDEPPKRQNRIACARGLVDFQGIEIFAMTLLKEAWIDQEVVNGVDENGQLDKSTIFFKGDIQDNVGFGITQEGVDQFAKTLTEDERSARLRGVPSYKSGIILNIDRNKHVKDRFKIPSSWVVDIGIDIGNQKAHDILYLATSPQGFKYVCFEETVPGSGENIAESIIQKIHRYNLRINRVICDPLAKGDSAGEGKDHTRWAKIDTYLNRHDMCLEMGAKHKNDGIAIINDLLMTVNKEPMLFFFRDLGKTVKQCLNWMYDKEGKPSKKDDDMCENLYRLALLETEWEEPYVEEYYNPGHEDRDKITGY